MNVFLLADGSGQRWGNHMGVTKHYAPIDGHLEACERAMNLFQSRVSQSCGSWHVYRAFMGVEDTEVHPSDLRQQDLGRMTQIHDWTDDIDYPEDYGNLVRYLARGR